MNKIILLCSFLVLCISCNKVKHNQKKLEGNWKIIQYQQTNTNNLVYLYPSDGIITFEKIDDKHSSIIIEHTYTKDGDNIIHKLQGEMELIDKEAFRIHEYSDGTYTTTHERGRIKLLTKDELKILYSDNANEHLFILSKN